MNTYDILLSNRNGTVGSFVDIPTNLLRSRLNSVLDLFFRDEVIPKVEVVQKAGNKKFKFNTRVELQVFIEKAESGVI